MEDHQIIDLFYERSEKALSKLAEKYEDNCMKISMNVLNSKQDSEECVNDSYLAMWNTIPPANPKPLKAYLYRIVRNKAIDKYKSNNRQKRNGTYDVCLDELEFCIEGLKTVEEEVTSRELSEHINGFLETLDAANQMLFVRRYWYMDSYENLAMRTGIKEGAIRTRIARVKSRLKEYLVERGYLF